MEPDVLLITDKECAFLGYATMCGSADTHAVYSTRRLVDSYVEDGMTEKEALEWIGYNIIGSLFSDASIPLLLDDLEVEDETPTDEG